MIKKILLTLMTLCILGIVIYVNVTNKMEYNDDFTIGNTPGNLMNNGLFCEEGNKIYFSNANDYDRLYSMDLDCKNFKKIAGNAVSKINCAGKYIYYASINNKYKDIDKTDSTGSTLSSGGIGLFRCEKNGDHSTTLYDNAVGNVSLAGNHLYYQHYDKVNGLTLYKVRIDGKEGNCLFNTNINPSGIYNGSLYYANTKDNHNIYKMSLMDDSYEMFLEGNFSQVLPFENYVYYLDLNNNYALTRVDLDGENAEVVVNSRVSTYNFSTDGTYLYYQIDNGDESRMCQMNLSTMQENILIKGNYCDINVTSKYVFFRGFDNNRMYVVEVTEQPKLNIFSPPVKK